MKYIFLVLFCISINSFAQKPAYSLVTQSGKEMGWNSFIEQLANADIVFLGEYHNNPICHWLEYEISSALFEKKSGKIIMGAEMFESDNQLILDEYLNGKIKQRNFEEEAKLWNNYKTDYKPLIEFAKEKEVNFIATNIPRRYASMVAAGGFEALESLSPEAKNHIAPLPVDYDENLSCYKNMMNMGGMGGSHANANLPKAQAAKDATMAFFIIKNIKPKYTFIHYNGSYHSDYGEGIAWYIKKKNPALKIVVISVSEVTDILNPAPEDINKGDFTILVPESMTKTY
jgi:uncharacterized iron-regulated protein